jgi:hypothetical protein
VRERARERRDRGERGEERVGTFAFESIKLGLESVSLLLL